jgi:hypothetical protein
MGSSRPEEVAFFLENIIHVPLPRNLIIRNRKNEGRRFALTIDVPGGGNARHGQVSFFTLLEMQSQYENRQWCNLGKNHFESVFLWIEWLHEAGRLGCMRMTGMILRRFRICWKWSTRKRARTRTRTRKQWI